MNSGGAKRFSYTGPKQKDSGDEWDTFSPTKKVHTSDPLKFDLDDVWSIKKNVAVGNHAQKPQDGLDLNMGKNYYSRHTVSGIKDKGVDENSQSPTMKDGRSWNQQKTYSYSYADPGRGSQSPSTAEYQNTSQRQNGLMGNSRHGNTGNPRQGKGGNVQSTGLHGSRYI